MYNLPADYDLINRYNSSRNPSTIHCSNTALTNFFFKYLMQKMISVFKWELPEDWDIDYFQYVLYLQGFIGVIDTPQFGVIPQNCTLTGRNIFYQPNKIIVTNPLLESRGNNIYKLGEEAELIKFQPDYSGIGDLVSYYADLMAVTAEGLGLNILNTKLAYVLVADNKAMAETLKKLYDRIASGEPAVAVDKNLINPETGKLSVELFAQNLQQNYIAGTMLDDLKKLDDNFCTEIGIDNANTQKKERLISSEVDANSQNIKAKSALWLDTMRRGVDRVNKLFGTDISVDYRQEDTKDEKIMDGDTNIIQ